ncbi:MAG: hypothetical protein R3324_02055 [Halobacteriales archaeon]|nr:hypothetical protein [Halobacteriales archaeon]
MGEDASAGNIGSQFDRLPATVADRVVEGRVSREEVLDYFDRRYGILQDTFDGYSFWEKGAGSVWILRGELPSPVAIEALGMRVLHTRQRFWKPTTNAIQRFGGRATRNVVELDRKAAATFVAGGAQPLAWEGDPGYLVVTASIAGGVEPLGVGLYTDGVLRSQIPKARRIDPTG